MVKISSIFVAFLDNMNFKKVKNGQKISDVIYERSLRNLMIFPCLTPDG